MTCAWPARPSSGWTEAITLVHEGHAPDDIHDEVRKHFTEEEAVNLWNRLAIGFRMVPGIYQPAGARKNVG